MSFVYAVKFPIECDGQTHKCTHIYSDTKISLYGAVKSNWGDKTRRAVERYGLIKSIIISPKCCISFAGNNIALAHQLLETLYELKKFSEEELLHHAFKIHAEHPSDDVEFIICLANEDGETEIICIKEHKIERNCLIAWIGSYDAFKTLRKYQYENPTLSDDYLRAFTHTIHHCGDETVGGFAIYVLFNGLKKGFEYAERFETVTGRAQKVLPGMQMELVGSASEGAYTTYYRSSNEDVIIEFEQARVILLYTRKYRLQDEDTSNPHTKHFLLPIVVDSDSGKVRPI